MADNGLFDDWPERYEAWFSTPIGSLVRRVEGQLMHDLLAPEPGDRILDAGCGTGVFTSDLLLEGVEVAGLDISLPMLTVAGKKMAGAAFFPVWADMQRLPFGDGVFDKAVSITALEFIADAKTAVDELFRVTRPGGVVVVATLNRLSPWAKRRQAKTASGERHILEDAHYRSGSDLLALGPIPGMAKTVVHFQKDDDAAKAMDIERKGGLVGLDTGAFVAARWEKPLRRKGRDENRE